MAIYEMEVKEYLARVVEVEASSIDDALDKVQKMYDEEEIVLDHNDYICTKIGLLKVD